MGWAYEGLFDALVDEGQEDLAAATECFDGVIFEGDGLPKEGYEKK